MRRNLILPAVASALLAACGGGTELDGTWESDRDAAAQVTIAGGTVTMTVPGLRPTVYEQQVESAGEGYRLHWKSAGGEMLRVDARLEGDRLLLSFDGQEFVLRRVLSAPVPE